MPQDNNLKMSLQDWAEYNGLDSAETIQHLLWAGGNAAAFCLHNAEQSDEYDDTGIEAFRVYLGADESGRVLECDYRFIAPQDLEAEGFEPGDAEMIRAKPQGSVQ